MAQHAFVGNAGVPLGAVRLDLSSYRAQAVEMFKSCSMIQKSQIKLAK